MKTRIFLMMLLAAALMISCQKEKEPVTTEQDVSFSAIKIDPDGGLKGTEVWPCKANVPDFAKVKINDTYYYPALFTLDGQLYTQAIKLAPGAYTVDEFVLYDDVDGIEGITDGDVIVFGTPEAGSTYAVYVTPTLPFNFTVEAFKKIQVEIQVLCFQDHLYTDFGFFWFHITEIVIREQCFFGDICIDNPALFTGSIYAGGGGVMVDEEAAIKVVVKANGTEVPNSPFDNLLIYGTGLPLCVEYPDVLGVVDNFTFELYVWVPTAVPGIFDWQLYGSFATTDAAPIPQAGDDGVVDFAIGDCSPDSYPIFDWLPAPEPPCYTYQGFESNIFGWDNGYGVATRVASGTNGISSSDGGYHAIFTEDVPNQSGPFTRYCGYVSTWPGTWTTVTDIYLDPSWATGQGFDYSVATNGSDGLHQRDFIFHIGNVAGTGLVVNASNNSGFAFNSYILLNENGGNYYVIPAAGWYTFKHIFYDNAGVLAVDFVLLDSFGNPVWTVTRSSALDLIPAEVGGHRYGWFTYISIDGGIAVDETNLY